MKVVAYANESVERFCRRASRKFDQIVKTMREGRYFEKPTTTRKLQKEVAKKRQKRQVLKERAAMISKKGRARGK